MANTNKNLAREICKTSITDQRDLTVDLLKTLAVKLQGNDPIVKCTAGVSFKSLG